MLPGSEKYLHYVRTHSYENEFVLQLSMYNDTKRYKKSYKI